MDAFRSNQNQGEDPSSASPSGSEEADSHQRRLILVVEDNKADVFLLRDAIQTAKISADLQVVDDGDKAIALINRAEADANMACPVLILLDLNLRRKGGIEVLEHIRRSRRCAAVPVVIVTSSDSEGDKSETARLGASHYFRKPSSYESFMRIGDIVRDLLLGMPAQA